LTAFKRLFENQEMVYLLQLSVELLMQSSTKYAAWYVEVDGS